MDKWALLDMHAVLSLSCQRQITDLERRMCPSVLSVLKVSSSLEGSLISHVHRLSPEAYSSKSEPMNRGPPLL